MHKKAQKYDDSATYQKSITALLGELYNTRKKYWFIAYQLFHTTLGYPVQRRKGNQMRLFVYRDTNILSVNSIHHRTVTPSPYYMAHKISIQSERSSDAVSFLHPHSSFFFSSFPLSIAYFLSSCFIVHGCFNRFGNQGIWSIPNISSTLYIHLRIK